MSDNRTKLVFDRETSRLNSLNEEWSKTINKVRNLEGFEDFLRPRRLSSLQAAASEGPVVILVANDDTSHVLIMTSRNIHHITVPSLPTLELHKLVRLTQAATSKSKIWESTLGEIARNTTEPACTPDVAEAIIRNWMGLEQQRGIRRYDGQINSDRIFKYLLRTLWSEVVKPVIDILELKKSEDLPSLRWCPTGLFSFLPIHAAGCYDDSFAIECASDYFISSYTPTIGALLTHGPTPSTEPFKMMVVIQSEALPSTREELAKIEQHVSNDALFRLGIPGANASVEAVASHLSEVSVVHFACHGIQSPLKPLDSGLKLEDGLIKVSRIMKEKMPNGSLAFLCACETAMGNEDLPDEAMSLGASLLFSGFRSVIATMWDMRDEDGPVIADTFYQELFRGPDGRPAQEPNTARSAHALHIAVQKLRAKNLSFRRWLPFIHMGN